MSVQLQALSTGRRLAASTAVAALLLSACGGDDSSAKDGQSDQTTQSDATAADAQGIRLVSAAQGAAIAEDPPEDLVILDVRTPEEFAEGHLEGAVLVDFYEDDFADQLADLDPSVPYLLYCNSGNRSGQTTVMMNDLGFTDVADIDGGIQAWNADRLPLAGG